MKKDSYERVFKDKATVLVIMPHPDDTELYCGGTVSRLISNGVGVVAVKVTNGGKGNQQTKVAEKELSAQRREEDRQAASFLGIRMEDNYYLNVPDGEVEDSLEVIEKLAAIFRRYRPDLLITCNPEDIIIRFSEGVNWINHRDHRHTALAAIDAAYPYSRDRAFFPHQLENLQVGYKPTTEFILADYYNHPDLVYIDITDQFERKVTAWSCHRSAYTEESARKSAEFLNYDPQSKKYFETFRHVIAD